MEISIGFYEVVANLIPVLLIALAVARFAATPDPDERPGQFTTGLGAIALLTVAEAVALAVVARGSSSRLADGAVVVALTFGWMLLVMAYANAMFEEFSRAERGHSRRRRLNLILLAIGIFSPIVFMAAYIVTLFA